MQDENIGPLVQKLFRILRWQKKIVKPSIGPSSAQGCAPIKLALEVTFDQAVSEVPWGPNLLSDDIISGDSHH